MKTKRAFKSLSLLGAIIAVVVGIGANASAAVIDSAVINARIFNDDPGSALTIVNNYPTLVEVSDTRTGHGGFANLHNFHLAEAGVEHAFDNNAAFSFSADLTTSGAGDGDVGIKLSPRWSHNVDGRFNLRTTDGEIAIFGGRLPFYSFTGSQGLTYTKGETVRVGMVYDPNSLSAGDPATIVYNLAMGATDYTSGPLAFTEGNPAEGFGSWGHLDRARVGGFVQVFSTSGNLTARWENMSYVPEPATLSFLALGSLAVLRQRRKQ
jgi:hypothetical protein